MNIEERQQFLENIRNRNFDKFMNNIYVIEYTCPFKEKCHLVGYYVINWQ